MNRLLRPLLKPATLLAVLAAATGARALNPTEWRYRQDLEVERAGLVRVELPETTFDGAAPELRDLRVLDAGGREVPSLLDLSPTLPARLLAPPAFTVRLADGATVLTFQTGTDHWVSGVTLETPLRHFIRPVRIEVSGDGADWQEVDRGVPVFRQGGAEQLTVPLELNRNAWVRLTIDDRGGEPLGVTGVRLHVAALPPPAPLAVGTRVLRREEFAGETVLTVAAAGRNLPLAGLAFDTPEPLFLRRVTIAVREFDGQSARERVVGEGTLYRVALEGQPVRARLAVSFNHLAASSELLVHIHNADSPPLALTSVQFSRQPLALYFHTPVAGRFTLLTGNPQAAAPHYDVAGFASDLRAVRSQGVQPGPRTEPAGYRAPEALAAADVPQAGAPLDTAPWTRRKAVILAGAGIQELELDPAVLAGARDDLGDLRLLRAGNQVPYLLESTPLLRALSLAPAPVTDAKRPNVSLWRLDLPQAGLPVRRLTFTTGQALFARQFRIYEKVRGGDGRDYEHVLGGGEWRRTPGNDAPDARSFELTDRPQTGTLFLETDNGDNAPLALTGASLAYPVARLVFQTPAADGYTLAYGHPEAGAPRYDLSLVAPRLLAAGRTVARLGPEEAAAPGAMQTAFQSLRGGAIFWAALAVVVVVLLVIVARMLPPPATK